MKSIESLIACGTKLYLDSVDPEELTKNLAWGAVGATSNPAIISEIVLRGSLDGEIEAMVRAGKEDSEIAWALTDKLVSDAEARFLELWKTSKGNTGWVSFELDPLLEDPDAGISIADRTSKYIELGQRWNEGHKNRMIKVPATEAGLAALEELSAAGITLNVTLIFTEQQYNLAREAVWRGAQRRDSLDDFKSVYSIFISRIDVYTEKQVPELSPAAQGQVGIVNAKQIWASNEKFWDSKSTPLEQEIIFASTGTKKPEDSPWKYVAALAGSDIQTNPPATNEAVANSGQIFTSQVSVLPDQPILDEIATKIDFDAMRNSLMDEGVEKFVKPQQALLKLIGQKRTELLG
jgi:transaldolase